MGLVLDFAYLVACVVLSPWILYRFVAGPARRDLAMRFGASLGPRLEASIWLHGSSAGEVSLLKPLIALLERDLPEVPLVITAFTSTGLAAARKLYSRHRVLPLPFDLSFVVRRYLKRLDPRLVIIVESEFWPNLIGCARRYGAAVAIVNGKMSPKSFRTHTRLGLIPRVLRQIDLLAVQTEEHAERFAALGVAAERMRVTGNMKYDLTQPPHPRSAQPLAEDAARLELRGELGYAPEDLVIVGGSLHEREDEALLDAYARARAANDRAALIVVPRYPKDAPEVERRARERGFAATLKSAVGAARPPPGRDGILIVDTVGELGRLYAAADLAFVGGSLFFRGANKGGHNLMEPAILAVPVLFGPYNFSFKETVEDLLAADAGVMVHDERELAASVAELILDEPRRRELGRRAQQVVRAGQGATARNYELLLELTRRRLPAPRFDRKMSRPANDLDSRL
ncbi:MAG TPA: glycosyltransferase N-terminal domain-containing protein [Gammaproteobacteria bacterium]|nr:glycosyltransferase N-terminal domain-containing protein [Gammaproteobacteria bacterium]